MNFDTLFQLDDRVAVVIGAGSGLGEISALALAAHGASVVCADLNLAAADRVAKSLNPSDRSLTARAVDVTETKSVQELLRGVRAEAGRLDIVVTTPGVNVRKPLVKYSDQEFERVLSINLRGTFNVLREAGAIMAEQGRGSLIAFSSIRAQMVEPGQGVYAATKAGIVQLVRALAAELGPQGVRVNAIAPGVVETPLTAPIKSQPEWYAAYAAKSALGRWARAEELAGPVVFLSSDAASYVTGSVLLVDGGWTAVDGRFQPPL